MLASFEGMVRSRDKMLGEIVHVRASVTRTEARQQLGIIARKMTPRLRDLRPDQVGVVQQPFGGRRHRMPQPGGFEQIAPGCVQRQFAFAQPRQNRALGPVGFGIGGTRGTPAGNVFGQPTHRRFGGRRRAGRAFKIVAQDENCRQTHTLKLLDDGLDFDPAEPPLQPAIPPPDAKRSSGPQRRRAVWCRFRGTDAPFRPPMRRCFEGLFGVYVLGRIEAKNDACWIAFHAASRQFIRGSGRAPRRVSRLRKKSIAKDETRGLEKERGRVPGQRRHRSTERHQREQNRPSKHVHLPRLFPDSSPCRGSTGEGMPSQS